MGNTVFSIWRKWAGNGSSNASLPSKRYVPQNFQELINGNQIVSREIKVKLSKALEDLKPLPLPGWGVETGLLLGCQSQPGRSIQLLDLSVVLENTELLSRAFHVQCVRKLLENVSEGV